MNSRHPDPWRVLGRSRAAVHATTSGTAGAEFQIGRSPAQSSKSGELVLIYNARALTRRSRAMFFRLFERPIG